MKRILDDGKEEVLSNKKIKYDNQQVVATNEPSHSEGQNNFNEKISFSDTDENVSESSSEGIEYNTDLNSSSSSETKEEREPTAINSAQPVVSNLETTKSGDAIDEVKNNSIETNELLLKNIIGSYMETLKKGVADKDTYDYLIASILEIYTECRNYTEVLNQIKEDVEGVRGNDETYNSLCGLVLSIAGHKRDISSMFVRDVTQDEVEWEDMIAGKVYDSICNICNIE